MKEQNTMEIQDFPLWAKLKERRAVLSFDLEVTARCNLQCRHCYINLPAGHQEARFRELTLPEISAIADQAVALGAMLMLRKLVFPTVFSRQKLIPPVMARAVGVALGLLRRRNWISGQLAGESSKGLQEIGRDG